MKSDRQNKILEIINRYDVETQEELSARLREEGFNVTQATVSRDINDLGLVKIPVPKGGSKYTVVDQCFRNAVGLTGFINQCSAVFDWAGNTVVIKCEAGMAQTLCTMLDREPAAEEIVGTLAGDDTVFVLMRTEEAAKRFCEKFAAE